MLIKKAWFPKNRFHHLIGELVSFQLSTFRKIYTDLFFVRFFKGPSQNLLKKKKIGRLSKCVKFNVFFQKFHSIFKWCLISLNTRVTRQNTFLMTAFWDFPLNKIFRIGKNKAKFFEYAIPSTLSKFFDADTILLFLNRKY